MIFDCKQLVFYKNHAVEVWQHVQSFTTTFIFPQESFEIIRITIPVSFLFRGITLNGMHFGFVLQNQRNSDETVGQGWGPWGCDLADNLPTQGNRQTLSCEYLREFSKKFETTLMAYSGAWGKLIHKKIQKSKGLNYFESAKQLCNFIHSAPSPNALTLIPDILLILTQN